MGIKFKPCHKYVFYRMISAEAHRSKIGCWNGGGPSKPPNFRSVQAHNDSNTVRGEKHRQKRIFQIMVLAVNIIMLSQLVMWTTSSFLSTKNFNKAQHDKSCDNPVCKPTYNFTIDMLLTMAGVETNPGPGSGHKVQCFVCSKTLSCNTSLNRHLRNVHQVEPTKGGKEILGKTFICDHCGFQFKRSNELNNHIKRIHLSKHFIPCRRCTNTHFAKIEDWRKHMKEVHEPSEDGWVRTSSAFQNRVADYTYMFNNKSLEESLGEFMVNSCLRRIRYLREVHGQIRYLINFQALMRNHELTEPFYFQSRCTSLTSGGRGVSKKVRSDFKILRERVLGLDVEQEGSGWSFESAEFIKLAVVKIDGHSMGMHIDFKPTSDQGKSLKVQNKYTTNVKSQDEKCSLYNIVLSVFKEELKHLTYKQRTEPEHLQPFLSRINTRGVTFPVAEEDLALLEHRNTSLNIAINVWRFCSTKHIEPFFISKNCKRGRVQCDMLLLHGQSGKGENVDHLIHIKDKAALFRGQTNNSMQKKLSFICGVCQLFRTDSEKKIELHFKKCRDPEYIKKSYVGNQECDAPVGNEMKLPPGDKSETPVLRMFIDFETLHEQKSKTDCEKCVKKLEQAEARDDVEITCPHENKKLSYVRTHLPAVCFYMLVLDSEGNKVYDKYHSGLDSASFFIETLLEKENYFTKIIRTNKKIIFTPEDEDKFIACSRCENCGKGFGDERSKVKDHDHLTGLYRSCLCSRCNLEKKNLLSIPVYCHNLRGFDSHLIIKAIDKRVKRFNVISRNEEQIISMQIGKYRFIDTMSFMPSSLSNLVNLLKDKDESKFVQTRRFAGKNFELFTEKGVFPYEYLTSVEKLEDQKLPAQKDFYSHLKQSGISEVEYTKAQNVWKRLNCNNLGSYMEAYCKSDVHLLADVWKNFCGEVFTHFQIQPEAMYVSLPGFAFDSFKKKIWQDNNTRIKLVDESNKQFHEDITKGIRGGLCQVNQKVAFDSAMEEQILKHGTPGELDEWAKNREHLRHMAEGMSKDGSTLETKKCLKKKCSFSRWGESDTCVLHAERCIVALDFNNLYGHAMTQSMPLDNFTRMADDELNKHQLLMGRTTRKMKIVSDYRKESNEGFIFVSRLEFSKKAQKKLLAYPCVPEKLVVDEDMLSKGQRAVWKKLFSSDYSSSTSKKMVGSFSAKQNYTSHYRLLAFYASLGVKVTLIRGYKFRQEKFIKSYVEFCAHRRSQTTNNSDKKLWKDMANIIFGKFIEDVRKRVNITYITDWNRMSKLLKYRTLSMPKIVNEDLVQVIT